MLPNTQTAPGCARLRRRMAEAPGGSSSRLRLQQLPMQHGRPALLPVMVAVVKGFWAGLMARGRFNGCMVWPDAVRSLREAAAGLVLSK